MCRCTGYRPIADAFKSFAKDADQALLDKLCDLEDLDFISPCALKCTRKGSHKDECFESDINNDEIGADEKEYKLIHKVGEKMMVVDAGKHKWYKAYNLSDVFKAMRVGDYKLIAGNTGQGNKKFYLLKPVCLLVFCMWSIFFVTNVTRFTSLILHPLYN